MTTLTINRSQVPKKSTEKSKNPSFRNPTDVALLTLIYFNFLNVLKVVIFLLKVIFAFRYLIYFSLPYICILVEGALENQLFY